MISPIEEIIEDFKNGKKVVLIDDENRENEGDIMMSAKAISAEDVNFMAHYARGLICVTLTAKRCEQLGLELMTKGSESGTYFTVSIDATETTTGISAQERACTLNKVVSAQANANDFIRPGHIFPIMAREGGTLVRAGHTEAGCDLSRLAGEAEPSSVIVEIMNKDGTMARLPDLEIFAKEHGLKLGTIADLIRYRMRNEKFMQLLNTCEFPTNFGDFSLHLYEDIIDKQKHIALTYGDIKEHDHTLVRVNKYSALHDVLHAQRTPRKWTMDNAMQRIVENGHGVIILLSPCHDEHIFQQVSVWNEVDEGAMREHTVTDDSKTFGKGAAILSDLQVTHMKVLGSPWGNDTFSGFGIEILDFITS